MSVEQIQALVDELAARLGRAVLVDDRDLRLARLSSPTWNGSPATTPGCARWPRRAIAVVAGRPGEELDGPVRALADEIGKAGPWRVAVGGPVPGPGGLPAARRQADIALSTLSAAGVACWAERRPFRQMLKWGNGIRDAPPDDQLGAVLAHWQLV